jgi:hypothetical protein
MTPPEPQAVNWTRVLDRITDTLDESLRLAAEPGGEPAAEGAAERPLQLLDERLARLRARLDQAERNAADADAVLQTEADALQRWLDAFAAARQHLADRAQRTPG